MSDYEKTSNGLYAYRYPRPSVTADSVLFAEQNGQLFVLLIQRANDPYKGCWAFPGGFLNMDETVGHCAERELQEETGIVLTGMQLVGIYSDVERDPRGRVITAAYTAMTTMPQAISLFSSLIFILLLIPKRFNEFQFLLLFALNKSISLFLFISFNLSK